MDKYELKELKVLLQVMKDRGRDSFKDLELYNKIIEELGENNDYEHIALAMIDKGWLKRLDKDMFLYTDSVGVKHYEYNPYYILTDRGLKELKRKKRKFNRPNVDWNIVVSVIGIIVTILLQRCVGEYV